MKLKVGDWVWHRIPERGYAKKLRVVCIARGLIFFDDRTHTKQSQDLSWLVPAEHQPKEETK